MVGGRGVSTCLKGEKKKEKRKGIRKKANKCGRESNNVDSLWGLASNNLRHNKEKE